METEAAHPHHPFFLSPQPHHLAELRIEPSHSAVSFSAPCAAAGRKRRCLLPASSPRKKMLLELPPFGSARAPSPSPPPSPRQRSPSPATVPPSPSRRAGSPASDFSFPSALAWTGGSGSGGGGGSIFAFLENRVTTPSPTGSNASAFSFLASPGHPVTPTGSTASGGVTFLASPKQPTTPTVPTASGCFSFLASPERPMTPSAGPTAGGGFAFFPSPGPSFGHTGSPASPAFVFSSPRTSVSPVRKSSGGSKKRSRRNLLIATSRHRSQRQWEEPHQVTLPPQKVAKTGALATGEASRSSMLSGSSATLCCTFFTSPAKAGKQEAKKTSNEASRSSSPYGSPAGSRYTFVTSPARPSSGENSSKREREVEVSSVAREGPTSPAACTGAEVVVRVTCTCGVQKEFCFDHCQLPVRPHRQLRFVDGSDRSVCFALE